MTPPQDLLSQPIFEILLAEDAPGDIRLTFEAFKKTTIESRLHAVKDGQEVLDYLEQKGVYSNAKRPNLIILDLSLPKLDGFEVLGRLKTDDRFKTIPVIVLTASTREEDIQNAYRLHANCYLLKPKQLSDFFGLVRALEDFWLSIARLPVV